MTRSTSRRIAVDTPTTPVPLGRWRRRQAAARLDQRGDIPGWVMITVMTITVASAVALMFAPAVTDYLRSALDQFK